MSASVSARSDDLRIALVAAGGVIAAILALGVLSWLSNAIASAAYSFGRLGPGSLAEWASPFLFGDLVSQLFGYILPVGIGIFVSFGLFWPIRAGRGIRDAVIRSVLAALVATALVMVFSTFVSLAHMALAFARPLDYNNVWTVASSLIAGFARGGASAAAVIPLAVIAGLGVWIWHRRVGLTDRPGIQ